MVGILKEVLDEKKLAKFMDEQEADFSYDFKGEARLRGNAFFQQGLASIVLRLIPKVKQLAELNLPLMPEELYVGFGILKNELKSSNSIRRRGY